MGGSFSSESECGTKVSEDETDDRTATSGGKFAQPGDVSNVDSVEEEFGSSETDSDGGLDNKTGCVGSVGCKTELKVVVGLKSSLVRAKSRASNSLDWLRFSVTNKFDTANLVS